MAECTHTHTFMFIYEESTPANKQLTPSIYSLGHNPNICCAVMILRMNDDDFIYLATLCHATKRHKPEK